MSYYAVECNHCNKIFKLSSDDYIFRAVAVIGQAAPAINPIKEVKRLFELGRLAFDSARRGIDSLSGEKSVKGKIEKEGVLGTQKVRYKRIICQCPHCHREVVIPLNKIVEV